MTPHSAPSRDVRLQTICKPFAPRVQAEIKGYGLRLRALPAQRAQRRKWQCPATMDAGPTGCGAGKRIKEALPWTPPRTHTDGTVALDHHTQHGVPPNACGPRFRLAGRSGGIAWRSHRTSRGTPEFCVRRILGAAADQSSSGSAHAWRLISRSSQRGTGEWRRASAPGSPH